MLMASMARWRLATSTRRSIFVRRFISGGISLVFVAGARPDHEASVTLAYLVLSTPRTATSSWAPWIDRTNGRNEALVANSTVSATGSATG
jgi:hypothetical protein